MLINLAFALQLHCGIQQLGPNSLSYGLLIYTSDSSTLPQLTYFEDIREDFSEHPHCHQLREKLSQQQPFSLILSDDGKKLIEVGNFRSP